METFVWVAFVARLIEIALGLLVISIGDYPRKREDALPWMDVIRVVGAACIAVWAGLLLYGERE